MSRVFAIGGGLVFIGSLLYFAASYAWRFDGDYPWSWTGARGPLLADVVLFAVFALHHSVFARRPFRAWIARIFPAELERSVYVWLASLLFWMVCAGWRPVPGVLWRASPPTAVLLGLVQIASAVFVLEAARRLDTLALAGVRQVFEARVHAPSVARPPSRETVLDTGPYRLVRHPIYLGWFLLVWSAPVMNGTRLVFAAVSCVYLLLAIPYEERDLRRTLGAAYDRYTDRVRWRILPGVY